MRNQTMPESWLVLTVCLMLALSTPSDAQEDPNWIYRGRMGGYAVIESAKDHSQQIVKVGKSVGGMEVVSIRADVVVLRRGGREIRLKRQAGYSQAQKADYQGIPPYPHAIPKWWTKTTRALDELQVTPRWNDTTPEAIYTQLVVFSGVLVSITPRATVKLAQRSEVSLNAERMTLRRAFDLLCAMLGTRWWIGPDGIQVGLPGEERQPPPEIAIQQGLAQARARAIALYDQGKRRKPTLTPAEQVRKALGKATADGQLQATTLAGLFRTLATRAGVTLVIDPSITKTVRKGPAEIQANQETINELILRLAASHKLGVVIEGSVVQLTSREQAGDYLKARMKAMAAHKKWEALVSELRGRQLDQAARDLLPYELIKRLEQTLGSTVYCDRATWELRTKFSFPQGTALRAVLEKLTQARIYPVFIGKTVYLIRGG